MTNQGSPGASAAICWAGRKRSSHANIRANACLHISQREIWSQELEERRLKQSRVSDLNDPFELVPYDLTNLIYRKTFHQTWLDVDHERGLLCFSGDWKGPVIWAHYSDKHRGLSLASRFLCNAPIFTPYQRQNTSALRGLFSLLSSSTGNMRKRSGFGDRFSIQRKVSTLLALART
jgi:hypothetical protein